MPMKSSMGAVIIGGMAAACVYTFVFIPVSFIWVYQFIDWMKRGRGDKAGEPKKMLFKEWPKRKAESSAIG
jgi:hypothetical protein